MLSISNVRHFLEKSGCATGVMVVVGIVLIVGFLGFGGGSGGPSEVSPEEAEAAGAVATVSGELLPAAAIDSMAQQQLQMFAQQMSAVPATVEASAYGYAIEEQLRGTALLAYAKRMGIGLDDDSVLRNLAPELEKSFQTQRESMVTEKLITANATEAQYIEAFKKKVGMTPQEAKNQQIANIKSNLQDPNNARQMRTYAANSGVLKAIAAGLRITDDQLKRNYDDFHTRRIFLDPQKHPNQNLQQLAEKIQAEIKGGLDFGEAMEKYSDEPAATGKKKEENTFIISGVTAQLEPEFAPVLNMKPDEVQIFKMASGISIFVLEAVVPSLPADFEKKKEDYRKETADRLAIRKMQEELTKIMEGPDVKWQSEGYHVLYDWQRLQSNRDLSADTGKRKAAIEAIKERAAKVEDSTGDKMANLARYIAFNSLWTMATPAEQAKMKPEKTEIWALICDTSPTVPMLFELADLQFEQKQNQEAESRVVQAVDLIQGDFSSSGQSSFGDIAAKFQTLKGQKLLTADGIKRIQEGLDRWRNERAEAEKAEAEAKKQEALDRAQAEAEQKKEDAKKKAAAPKAPAAGSKPAPAKAGASAP